MTHTYQDRPSARIPQLAALLVFASALVVGGCKKAESETTGAAAEAVSNSSAAATQPANLTADSIVVYYFHGNRRCRTCMGIQRAIQTTVSERFGAETASGALVFREVNIDEPSNAHFVKEFDLSSSSMVVAWSPPSLVIWLAQPITDTRSRGVNGRASRRARVVSGVFTLRGRPPTSTRSMGSRERRTP